MEPYQFLKLDAYGISAAQCREEAKFVSSDGTVTGGHMAFAELFKGSGRLWWVLGSTLSLPGLRSFAGVVYRWVAKNRYRLPGGTPTCAMNKSET